MRRHRMSFLLSLVLLAVLTVPALAAKPDDTRGENTGVSTSPQPASTSEPTARPVDAPPDTSASPGSSGAANAPLPELGEPMPFDPEAALQSVDVPGTRIVWKSGTCTVTAYCASGGSVSCSGSSCSTTQLNCPTYGSTCPVEDVLGVVCNGHLQDQCECEEVCFGCGVTCEDQADCNSACTCGLGFCEDGSCLCPY